MAGYWQRPEDTAETMFEGGWLRTGDMGRMDEKASSLSPTARKT